jgi:hypothetical protein
MAVKQLSVLLEHKPGEMSKVSDLLGREGINIGGLTLADAGDLAIVRLITDNPAKSEAVLKSAGYHVKLRDVIAVETPDHPGGLNAVLKPLADAGINVKYFYPYLRRVGDEAVLIFRTEDNEKAEEALRGNWIRILGEEIYSL